jgi:hypothetical protein
MLLASLPLLVFLIRIAGRDGRFDTVLVPLQHFAHDHPNWVSFAAGILVFAVAPLLIKGLFVAGSFLKRPVAKPNKPRKIKG